MSALKRFVDDAFRMADDIGKEGVKELERKLKEFQSWCNNKCVEKLKNMKRTALVKKRKTKNVPITSDKYTSNLK